MTCIVGVVGSAGAVLGADAKGSDTSYGFRTRVDRKLVTIAQDRGVGLICGATGDSFRPLQILSLMTAPHDGRADPLDYLLRDFVPAWRRELSGGGWATKDSEREWAGGVFLVGYRGRLFTLWSDYSVAQAALAYEAIGSGGPFALGALAAMERAQGLATDDAQARAHAALEIACALSSGVGPPFAFLTSADSSLPT